MKYRKRVNKDPILNMAIFLNTFNNNQMHVKHFFFKFITWTDGRTDRWTTDKLS